MAKRTKASKGTRRRYSVEFKREALALADKVGVAEAATQLKLTTSQLYAWRTRAQAASQRGAAEQALASENARLKRQLAEKEQEIAILKKASAYFARSLT